MAIELKQVLEYLGIDQNIEDMDALKASIDESLIRYDKIPTSDKAAGMVWGKKTAFLQKALKKVADQFELEIPDPNYKTVSHEDTIVKLAEQLNEKLESERETLKGQAKGDNTGAVAELEKKIKKLEKDLNEKTTLLGNVTGEYEKYKGETTKEKRDRLLKESFESAKSKLKLVKDLDPLRMRGFASEFHELYDLQTDDEMKEAFAIDRSNSQRPKSNKKVSEFATIDEILEGLALKHKILDLTPAQKGGAKPEKINHFNLGKDNDDEGGNEYEGIHPQAVEAMKREKEAANK